jgi:hypothetical protein
MADATMHWWSHHSSSFPWRGAARLELGLSYRRDNDMDRRYFGVTLIDPGLHATTTAPVAVRDFVQLDAYFTALVSDGVRIADDLPSIRDL